MTDLRRSAALLVYVGNTLTLTGCLALICGSIGLIPMESFALGISSGIRMIATVAITGCLLSAIGYGLKDYFDF